MTKWQNAGFAMNVKNQRLLQDPYGVLQWIRKPATIMGSYMHVLQQM
jgi:hypothetical protein